MKICFAIGTLQYSGAEKIMYHLIKEFSKSDDVSVILISSDKPFEGIQNVTQYPIYRSEEDSKGRVIRTLKRQRIIRNIIKNSNFDVVVSFGVMFNVDIAESCIGLKTKIILCERNDPINDPRGLFRRLRRRVSYIRGNGFVFQTDTIKSFFSRRIQNRSVVIPNFIEYKVESDQIYNPENPTISTCCRLDDHQKDLSLLIHSFAEILNKYKDYILKFYGDGPDKEKLLMLTKRLGIENAVVFLGRVNNPMTLIRKDKIFVLSTKYEGMPNALLEAMSYGMPCISTDCSGGGPRAIIQDRVNGYLVPLGDQNALTHAILNIIENTEKIQEICENAYKVNETYSMDRILPMWRSFIYSYERL